MLAWRSYFLVPLLKFSRENLGYEKFATLGIAGLQIVRASSVLLFGVTIGFVKFGKVLTDGPIPVTTDACAFVLNGLTITPGHIGTGSVTRDLILLAVQGATSSLTLLVLPRLSLRELLPTREGRLESLSIVGLPGRGVARDPNEWDGEQ